MLFGRILKILSGMCSPLWKLSHDNDMACPKSTIVIGVKDPENAGTYNVWCLQLLHRLVSKTPKMPVNTWQREKNK